MSQWRPPVKALQDQLAVLKTKYEEPVTYCCHLKKINTMGQESIFKREDSLQQCLNTEEDWQKTKTYLNWQSSEDKWCKEVSQLKELLKQKDPGSKTDQVKANEDQSFGDILNLLTIKEGWTPATTKTLEEKLQMTLKRKKKRVRIWKRFSKSSW